MYNPKQFNPFSTQGEAMVLDLMDVAPGFHHAFNRFFPLNQQTHIAQEAFNTFKTQIQHRSEEDDVFSRLNDREMWLNREVKATIQNPKFKFRYFEVNRKFSNLVPLSYKRTAAPRLTTTGSTFHGMKKELQKQILKTLSLEKNVTFVELDMGAAHARVASSLIGPDSLLAKSLIDGNFWDNQAAEQKQILLNAGVDLDLQTVRKMLKVALYTSLNGGNPGNEARVFDNLRLNATERLVELRVSTLEEAKSLSLFKPLSNILGTFPLAQELKDLNKLCFSTSASGHEDRVFTLDREEPYIVDSVHLAISRLLQGFEVVMLTVLVKEILKVGGLPISLDHDGVLVMFQGSQNLEIICKGVTENMSPWTNYLLDQRVPIDFKSPIFGGRIL